MIDDSSEGESDLVKHDPGQRTKSLMENRETYLITLGPHQSQLASFPCDEKDRRFWPACYKEFGYLEYSTDKDAAFCFVCSLFPEGIGKEKKKKLGLHWALKIGSR